MKPRIGLLRLWQETNTYSPRRTGVEQFREHEMLVGLEIVERHRGAGTVLGGFLSSSELECVPVISVGAWPGGLADRATIEWILDRVGIALRDAGRLDGYLLDLHGAMVAECHPDVEADVVRILRSIAPSAPTACVLDLHGIPSVEFTASIEAIVGYETYPHVDMYDRGAEAARLMAEMVNGHELSSTIAKIPLLTSPLAQASDEEPMATLWQSAREASRLVGGKVSLFPGFPYSDVSRAGFSVVGTASRSDEARLKAAVRSLSREVESVAAEFRLSRPGPTDAVAEALAEARFPTILVDIGDNVGAGGAGDGTALLAALLGADVEGAVVTLSDPDGVAAAIAAGIGGHVSTKLGARLDDRHGRPLLIDGMVETITDGHYISRGSYMTGLKFEMGRTALLRVGGVRVVVTERAVPPFHAEQLTSLGVEPGEASVIAAKGAVAWRSAFGDVARHVIEVDTPGVTPLDPLSLPRTTEPSRFMPGDLAP